MIWLSVEPRVWTKAELRRVGAGKGDGVAVVVNPFPIALGRGQRGRLCTGPSVWTFVVAEETAPGEDVVLELRDHEVYDERRHGALRDRDPGPAW
jgi:hypothetical protein